MHFRAKPITALLATTCSFLALALTLQPAHAAGTVIVPPAPPPVTPSQTQHLPTDGGLTCAQQLTNFINTTTDTALTAQVAGVSAAALAAAAEAAIVDIPVAALAEGAGLAADAVGLGGSIAAQVGAERASGLPSCDQQFVGTVTVSAGGSNITGNSIFQNSLGVVGDLNVGGNLAATTITSPNPATLGGVTVGNAAGTQRGIELGGGSLSGAGAGANAVAGDINAIAIGNGAMALSATSTAIGTGAMAFTLGSTALGSAAAATAANTTAVGASSAASAAGSSAFGFQATASNAAATALGASSLASGVASSAVGNGAAATGTGATASGQGAIASGDFSTSVGQGSVAVLNSTTTGAGAQAIAANTTAVGQGALASGVSGVALGQGARATDVNATALGAGALAGALMSTAIGQGSTASGVMAAAVGAGAAASGAAASTFGTSAVAAFDGSTALGSGARTTANGSVALGQGSIAGAANGGWAGFVINNRAVTNNATATSVVSVGGGAGSATPYRQVTNVADGAVNATSTDATNGSQLYKAVSGLNTEILNTRREAREGVAGALALTAAPMPSQGGKTTYAANFGFFKDAAAFGGSFAHRLDTNIPLAMAAGIAVSGNGTLGGRVGVLGEF